MLKGYANSMQADIISYMKITKVEVFQKTYSVKGGSFVISGGKVAANQDATIVKVHTDSEIFGWGEQCAFSPNYLVAHGEGTRAAMSLLAPSIIGLDPRQTDLVFQKMESTMKGHQYAKSALDIACWDIFGKATNMRLGDLLGGIRRERIPVYAPISLASPEEMALKCRAATALGFTRFQMKVGTDWKTDIARIRACMEVLSGAEKVIFDANGNWSQHDAIRVVSSVNNLDIYIEQPCATIEECARVRERSIRPFIIDESLSSTTDILTAYQAKAMDAVMLKLSRFGGITPVKHARDLCASLGLSMTIEDSGGGDIVSAAMAHLTSSIPSNLMVNGFLVGAMVEEHISDWSTSQIDGFAEIPKLMGLGINVDEKLLGNPIRVYSNEEF